MTQWYTGTRLVGKKSKAPLNKATSHFDSSQFGSSGSIFWLARPMAETLVEAEDLELHRALAQSADHATATEAARQEALQGTGRSAAEVDDEIQLQWVLQMSMLGDLVEPRARLHRPRRRWAKGLLVSAFEEGVPGRETQLASVDMQEDDLVVRLLLADEAAT